MRMLAKVIARFGAPLLLCLVAVVQQFWARQDGLSPWKGGGFGMFSTVNSPSSRFLRVYLCKGNKAISVEVPGDLQTEAVEVRTIPDTKRLSHLARQVAQTEWIGNSVAAPNAGTTRRVGDDEGQNDLNDKAPADDVATATGGDRTGLRVSVYRPADRNGYVSPGVERVSFDSVRVELWQIRFDPDSARIRSEQLYAVIAPRSK